MTASIDKYEYRMGLTQNRQLLGDWDDVPIGLGSGTITTVQSRWTGLINGM